MRYVTACCLVRICVCFGPAETVFACLLQQPRQFDRGLDVHLVEDMCTVDFDKMNVKTAVELARLLK